MTTFTEEAEQAFTEGLTACDRALANNNELRKLDDMAAAIQDLCSGFVSLSRGLRATYIKIEQVESMIRQLEHRGSGLLSR